MGHLLASPPLPEGLEGQLVKSGLWFLAKYPDLGKRRALTLLMSKWFSFIDNAWMSSTLLPDAAATRNIVFDVMSSNEAPLIGS